MPREIANVTEEQYLNVPISSVWQQISQELHAEGIEISQARGARGSSGTPGSPEQRKTGVNDLPEPINLYKPFPSSFRLPEDDWPLIPKL